LAKEGEMALRRERAIEALVRQGLLKREEVIEAFRRVPRELFLPEEVREDAYVDAPLPIGHGQTTSALHMTAIFCEWSGMDLGDEVLEVGSGCGYMSCVYAEVVAPTGGAKEAWGHVWTAEIIKELADYAKENVERAGYADRVTVVHADASGGLGDRSFDVIIVTSAAPEVPEPLVEQLKPNGVMLIPVGELYLGQDLIKVAKRPDGGVVRENLGGVAFVPMRGKYGWKP
jgi:protein-L-isoaspartate(D-aspartate) O-methyltransferase